MDWTITSDSQTMTFTLNGVGKTFQKSLLSFAVSGVNLLVYYNRDKNSNYFEDKLTIPYASVASPSASSATDLKEQSEELISGDEGGGAGYLVYTALISQSSTDAPTISSNGSGANTAFSNTASLGAWTYASEGGYIIRLNANGAGDIISKIWYSVPPLPNSTSHMQNNIYVEVGWNEDDDYTYLKIYTMQVNLEDSSPLPIGADGLLYNHPIEIRINP